MTHDVELLRTILLYLETREVSPRSTVMIDVYNEAEMLERGRLELLTGLNILLDLDYIEGPGLEGEDTWLFRKLTRKGREFVAAARNPRDWERMKRARLTRSTA